MTPYDDIDLDLPLTNYICNSNDLDESDSSFDSRDGKVTVIDKEIKVMEIELQDQRNQREDEEEAYLSVLANPAQADLTSSLFQSAPPKEDIPEQVYHSIPHPQPQLRRSVRINNRGPPRQYSIGKKN